MVAEIDPSSVDFWCFFLGEVLISMFKGDSHIWVWIHPGSANVSRRNIQVLLVSAG
jgi:hypothetical protein